MLPKTRFFLYICEGILGLGEIKEINMARHEETRRLQKGLTVENLRAAMILAVMFGLVLAGCGNPMVVPDPDDGAPLSARFAFTPVHLERSSASAGTVAGTFNVPVGGGTAPFTYSLVSGAGDTDNAWFVIDGNSLKVGAAQLTADKTYSVRVRARDRTGQTIAKACIFAVAPYLTQATIVNPSALAGYISAYCALGTAVNPKVMPFQGSISAGNLTTVHEAVNVAATHVIWDLGARLA
jgi:hypothetical protein